MRVENIHSWLFLVPVQLSPRPSQLIDHGDIQKPKQLTAKY